LNPSAEAADIETLRERAQRVADRVTELEHRLSDLGERKDALAARIGDSSAQIGMLELQLNDAERSMDAARDIVEERAVEVYKSSIVGEDLEKLLSASDLYELELIAEVQAAAAQADDSALEDLQETAGAAEAAQSGLEERKSTLLAAQAEVTALEAEIDGGLEERQEALAELSGEIEALQAEARRAAQEAARAAERDATTPTVPSGLPAPTGDLAARLEGTGPTDSIPDLFTTTGVAFEGEASWYGPGFEGNLTANGDVYDSSLFTAASKTLPLNTYLYIEYEGRGCIVLVNDRGPYVGNRILDLSRGTAAAIGMEHAGIGWVRAEILVRN
jgi:peptidoglycan hydrolase CwlO-like protein